MTLQEEITIAAQNAAQEQRKSRIRMPRGIGGFRNQLIYEFVKWLFFCLGAVGIIVSNRFIQWAENINFLSFFTFEIFDLPFATLFFAGILLLACILATLQKRAEIASRTRADEAANLLSELAVDLGKGPKTVYVGKEVLAELGEIKKLLSESLVNLETMITTPSQSDLDLTKIKGIGPKTIELLKTIGITSISDLLKVTPEDLAEKTGISPKIVSKWLEDAKASSNL
jgi:hypothetical protein